jgi:hypothetical protein
MMLFPGTASPDMRLQAVQVRSAGVAVLHVQFYSICGYASNDCMSMAQSFHRGAFDQT